MLWLRKSKKGFTLIELMVVVAIIGVLALLGLRTYTGQQEKAKNALVKANVGTIQTLIQAELADRPVSDLDDATKLTDKIFANAGIYNPVTGNAQDSVTGSNFAAAAFPTAPPAASGAGNVVVYLNNNVFYINGNTAGTTDEWVFTQGPLTARK